MKIRDGDGDGTGGDFAIQNSEGGVLVADLNLNIYFVFATKA